MDKIIMTRKKEKYNETRKIQHFVVEKKIETGTE